MSLKKQKVCGFRPLFICKGQMNYLGKQSKLAKGPGKRKREKDLNECVSSK